jgi:hypothetical protein
MEVLIDEIQRSNNLSLPLTKHAFNRMYSRGLSQEAVNAAIDYGRDTFVRGAKIYAIGRKEINMYKEKGIDLSDYEGVQVVCSSKSGDILTVYRNNNFRGLRPRGRRGWNA